MKSALILLEAIPFNGRATKLYNAGSSECFGDLTAGQADETMPFRPAARTRWPRRRRSGMWRTIARSNELRMSRANPAKAQARLGWKAEHAMPEVVKLMIAHEGKGG